MFSITSLTFLLLLSPLINACTTKFNPCNRRSLCGLGTCLPSEDCFDFKCTCPPGFTGKFCEITNLPSCGSNSRTQCKNGGICHNILSGFVCQCPKGFYGFACEFSDPSVPENWGVPSIEDDDDLGLMMDIPEGWKRVDDKLIVVTKIATLDELKSQLNGLFEEIRNFTNIRLEFSRFEDGEEFIHGEDCSDDTQKCQYTANLFALVPENDTDVTLDNVMSLLMNPVFPNHLNPEELHVDDNTGKAQKPLSWLFIGVVGVAVVAMMVVGSFGGLLHTSRGRPFKYGTIVKKAPVDVENAVPCPQVQHHIQLQIHVESKLKLLYSDWCQTSNDEQFIRFIRTYRSAYDDSALHLIARAQRLDENENIKVAGKLIQMGVDINSINKQGNSPMETAVLHNQAGLAKFFMENQANVLLQNSKNGYTLLIAAIHMKEVNLVRDILALPQAETLLNMATKSDYPQSPLTMAVNEGQMEILKSILDFMIKKKIVNDGIVNPKMKQVGYTALHYAALGGSVESAMLILDYEKNNGKKNKKYVQFVDREDYQGQTPLQTAVVCKWVNVIRFLLEAGSDPNHKDLVGKSAYNLAEESKDEEFKQQFDEICVQTRAPKKVIGGKKRTYRALIQQDAQPIHKQSRPNQVDNRRISMESGIASADSSFSSTCSPNLAPQVQSYLPPFGNWNQPGYDFSQFNPYQPMNSGYGMQGNDQINPMNGTIITPAAAGSYGNFGLPSFSQNNMNINLNLFNMNPRYHSLSTTTLTSNSPIYPQASYSSSTTLNIPQSSQLSGHAINSHSNSPQVLSPSNLIQDFSQNYQVQYPYPSSNYSMNMQMTGSQMSLNQTEHMKSQYNYLSSQRPLNNWPNSNQ